MKEGRWIDVDGIRTRYYEAGSGEPIVFVYGGNFGTGDSASSAYTWSERSSRRSASASARSSSTRSARARPTTRRTTTTRWPPWCGTPRPSCAR